MQDQIKFSLIKVLMGCMMLLLLNGCMTGNQVEEPPIPHWVDVQIIDIDFCSRRGLKLKNVKDIVIHYVGNPGSTAQANRDYFASAESEVSSHFVVGLEGEIIQCVPLDEYSSASNWRNNDTISIEVTHPDETGEFYQVTYDALVQLTSWLCDSYQLGPDRIIRHYDITGKDCPRYFVKHEDEWELFKINVQKFREL